MSTKELPSEMSQEFVEYIMLYFPGVDPRKETMEEAMDKFIAATLRDPTEFNKYLDSKS